MDSFLQPKRLDGYQRFVTTKKEGRERQRVRDKACQEGPLIFPDTIEFPEEFQKDWQKPTERK